MAVIRRTLYRRQPPQWRTAWVLWLRRGVPVLAYVLALVALGLVMQWTLTQGQRMLDDMRYGMPRQVSAVAYVGQGDERLHPTVIEAFNINGQISVLVVPGGDVAAAQWLDGPYLVGSAGQYAVPHITLRDVNNDTHPDLLVVVHDEAVVYINEQGAFRLTTPDERAQLQETSDGA